MIILVNNFIYVYIFVSFLISFVYLIKLGSCNIFLKLLCFSLWTMMPQCLNVFILLVLIKASVCLKNCTSEQYWNKSAEECQACSHCKLPQITRIPCNRESDVVCMQLKKLNFVSTVLSSKLFKTKLS